MSKKNIIGLSTLLLVLLLGLFTTSYASFTMSDIKNLAWARCKNRGYTDYMAQVTCDKLDAIDLSAYENNDRYAFVGFIEQGSSDGINFCVIDKNLAKRISGTTQKKYITVYYTKKIGGNIYNTTNYALSNFTLTSSSGSKSVNVEGTATLYSPEYPCYDNRNNNNSIVWQAPIINPSWFKSDGPYTDWEPVWEWTPISDQHIVKVPYSQGYSDCYEITKTFSMTDIGYLANSRYAKDIYVVIDAFNYDSGRFETIIGPEKVWDQNYGSITDYYSTEFISDGDSGIWNSFIRYPSNNFGNNFVLHFSSSATDLDYENYLEPYGLSKSTDLHLYIGDNHTALSGDGYLDLDNTFNDNYKDDYNNQIDNSLNNHDSNVNNDKIIGSLDSINDALTETTDPSFASGDFPLYEVDDPTVNFFDYLINRISTVFLTNEAVNLNINIPYLTNGDYLLNSDFFILSGPLLLFIQAFLFIFLILPKINDVHEVIKAMQMGYSDAFIRYFGYGISIDDLL